MHKGTNRYESQTSGSINDSLLAEGYGRVDGWGWITPSNLIISPLQMEENVKWPEMVLLLSFITDETK